MYHTNGFADHIVHSHLCYITRLSWRFYITKHSHLHTYENGNMHYSWTLKASHMWRSYHFQHKATSSVCFNLLFLDQAPNLVENEVIPLKGLFSQENFFFGYDNVRKLNANENNDNLSCVSNLIFSFILLCVWIHSYNC